MSLRWGANRPGDTEAARERLVDAAEECLERFGIAKTTVEDVASAASVSRATVYRYFGDRDELILAVLVRDVDRLLDRVKKRFTPEGPLGTQLVDGILYWLGRVQREQKLGVMFAPDATGHTVNIPGAYAALFERARAALQPALDLARRRGELRADIDLDEAVEWIMRVVISLLTVDTPMQQNRQSLARFLERFLVPSLVAPVATNPLDVGGATR